MQCVRSTIIIKDTPENINLILHELQSVQNSGKIQKTIYDTTIRVKDFDFNTNFKIDPKNVIDYAEFQAGMSRAALAIKIPKQLIYTNQNPLYVVNYQCQNIKFENLPETNTNKNLSDLTLTTINDLRDINKNPVKICYTFADKLDKQIVQAIGTNKLSSELLKDYKIVEVGVKMLKHFTKNS